MGDDCYAPGTEGATCSGGYEPFYTDTAGNYKCCALSGTVAPNYQCDASYCTSFANDCYAPGTEAATCSGGYEPFYTDTAGNYKCCALSGTVSPPPPPSPDGAITFKMKFHASKDASC